MSKKDYEQIAVVLARELATVKKSKSKRSVVENVVRSMADMLAADNFRFSRSRFYDAVGTAEHA